VKVAFATLVCALAAGAGCGGGGGGGPAGVDAAGSVDDSGGPGDDGGAPADAPVTPDGLPPGLNAIMVTNGAATLSPGDVVMVDRLRGRGFVVTFVSDVAATADGVAGQDLIVISSSAESGPLGTKIRDVAIPIVCIENGAFPTMGLAGPTLATDYGSTFNQTMVTIAGVASPGGIATGGLTGAVTITAVPAELGWAQPATGAIIAATMADNPAHAMLFGYTAGSPMVGLAAPAGRVGYAIRETAAANLTADGLALFDAAVTFALSP
jgi:hypothetical protein